jgi:hypothetical protein
LPRRRLDARQVVPHQLDDVADPLRRVILEPDAFGERDEVRAQFAKRLRHRMRFRPVDEERHV